MVELEPLTEHEHLGLDTVLAGKSFSVVAVEAAVAAAAVVADVVPNFLHLHLF